MDTCFMILYFPIHSIEKRGKIKDEINLQQLICSHDSETMVDSTIIWKNIHTQWGLTQDLINQSIWICIPCLYCYLFFKFKNMYSFLQDWLEMPMKNKTVILIPLCKIKKKQYYKNSRPSGAFKLHDDHLKSLVEEVRPESNKMNLKVTLVF